MQPQFEQLEAQTNTDPSQRGLLTRGRALVLAGAVLTTSLVACSSGDDGEANPSAATTDPTEQVADTTTTTMPTEEICAAPDATVELEDVSIEDRVASYSEVVHGNAELEQRVGEEVFSGAMEFFAIPADDDQLAEALSWQVDALLQLRDAGLVPTIVLEPGEGFDFNDPDPVALDNYFSAMKEEMDLKGGTDADWGNVVLAPEPIVGGFEYGSFNAANYINSVNTMAASLCEYFPGAKPTVMIDTYTDEKDAILNVLDALDANETPFKNIDSVGIQMYANSVEIPFDEHGNADVSGYMSAEDMVRIADAYGVNKVWVSAGIIKTDEGLGVSYSTEQRQAIALAEAEVIRQAQEAGLEVLWVTNFAIDKTVEGEGEGRNFAIGLGEEAVITTLSDALEVQGVPLSGFTIDPAFSSE